jgi:hypothetical protein
MEGIDYALEKSSSSLILECHYKGQMIVAKLIFWKCLYTELIKLDCKLIEHHLPCTFCCGHEKFGNFDVLDQKQENSSLQ